MANEIPRSQLADLVRSRIRELELSSRALADACGPLWSRGTLDNLLAGREIKPPTLPRLAALANGLQLPLGPVQEAAGAQFLGIDTIWSQDGEVRTLVIGYLEMDPEDQRRVAEIVESRRRIQKKSP